jgi:hypothetical protein
VLSPDSRLFATEQDHNLAIRVCSGNSVQKLSQDGTEKLFWSVAGATWSPDNRLLVAEKVDESQQPTVPVVQLEKEYGDLLTNSASAYHLFELSNQVTRLALGSMS